MNLTVGALILTLLLGQIQPIDTNSEGQRDGLTRVYETGGNLESTDVEAEKFGRDSYIVTERPQMWNKPGDAQGTQQRCEVDKHNPNKMTCYDWNIR